MRFTKSALLFFVVLYAVAASAQTVGDEVVSDPMPLRRSPATLTMPALALARDRSGIAVAWQLSNASGVDRIYVARLNAEGNVAGSARELPLSSMAMDPAHATAPSIAAAPGGDGFVVAWTEIDAAFPGRMRPAFCRLDASLTPSAPSARSTASRTDRRSSGCT